MLQNRGYIKKGYFADLTVFDEEQLEKATPDKTQSFGIEKVFINGKLVLDGESINEQALKTTGRALPVK